MAEDDRQIDLAHLSIVLDQVRHENELMNHRMTWLWTVQGLLFASFGLLLGQTSDIIATFTVCVVGIVSSVSIGHSLSIGRLVLDDLNPMVHTLAADCHLSPKALTGCNSRRACLFLPWTILPWFFAAVWIALAAYLFFWK